MKYLLLFMCDVCGKKARAHIVSGGIKLPDGWGCREWPSGEKTLACSPRCSHELGQRPIKSILVPKPLPLVRSPAVSMATRASRKESVNVDWLRRLRQLERRVYFGTVQ